MLHIPSSYSMLHLTLFILPSSWHLDFLRRKQLIVEMQEKFNKQIQHIPQDSHWNLSKNSCHNEYEQTQCTHLLQYRYRNKESSFLSWFLSFQILYFHPNVQSKSKPMDSWKSFVFDLSKLFREFRRHGMNSFLLWRFLPWRNNLFYEDQYETCKYMKRCHQFHRLSMLWITCNIHHNPWRKFRHQHLT